MAFGSVLLRRPEPPYNGLDSRSESDRQLHFDTRVSNEIGKLAAVEKSGTTASGSARAMRLGEMRDRSFENQRYRASGLTLVVAAIILWNTVYLSRAIDDLKAQGVPVDDNLLEHLSPLGWEHINLTGDYVWRQNRRVESGKFRPLRLVFGSLTYDFFRFVR